MAISIENSRLYSHLEERVAERSHQLEQAHTRIVALERKMVEKQMAGGFAHEIRNALSGAELVLSKALGREHTADGSINGKTAAALKGLRGNLKLLLSPAEFGKVEAILDSVVRNQEQINRILVVAHRAAGRGLLITKRILEYSKIGEELPGSETINLNEVIQRVVSEIEPDTIDKNIEVILELQKDPTVAHRL